MYANEMKVVMKTFIRNGWPIMIKGAAGIGKTDLGTQVVDELNAEENDSYAIEWFFPAIGEQPDYKGTGFPNREKGVTEFLPDAQLSKLFNPKKKIVAFIDDLGQAEEDVQKAIMQLILARRINGKKISDN